MARTDGSAVRGVSPRSEGSSPHLPACDHGRTLLGIVPASRSSSSSASTAALAVVGGRLCSDLVEVTSDLAALESSGFWAVVLPFEGEPVCARFATVRPARPWPGPRWVGPDPGTWTSSLSREQFMSSVTTIRERIAAGDVYQVNLTRRLSAPLPTPTDGRTTDIAALGAALALGNPAPYSAVVRLPSHGIAVASASPERFLRLDGDVVRSSPIKGTAATADGFLVKDRAENVMIVDLVRNDLGRVCEWGSVAVPDTARRRAAPRAAPPCQHRRGPAASRDRLGRRRRGDLPPGLGHRRPEAGRARVDRRARAGAPGDLLRSDRLGRRGSALW